MLCSCAGNPLQFVEDAIEDNGWGNVLEDNELHEEVFNKAPISFGERKNTGYSGDIGLGVQRTAIADGKLSVRFIAAVTLGVGDLADTTAVWTRAVYNGSTGTAIKASATKESTSAYTSLYDGSGELYTIAKYNSDHSTSHTHFVVYTLLDIPEDNVDDYITAYVTVDSKSSKVAATTVDLNTKFLFDKTELDSNNVFGVKKVGGVYSDWAASANHPDWTGGNWGEWTGVENAGESIAQDSEFIFARYYSGNFRVFGYDYLTLGGSADKKNFVQSGSSQFISSPFSMTQKFYLSANDATKGYIYLGDVSSMSVTMDVYFHMAASWDDAGAYFCFAIAGGAQHKFAQIGETDYYVVEDVTFDPSAWIGFLRMNPAYPTPSWDNGHVWTECGQYLDNHAGNNMWTPTALAAGNEGVWSTYTPAA